MKKSTILILFTMFILFVLHSEDVESSMDCERLIQLIDSDSDSFVLIDVREKNEHDECHIPGSLSIEADVIVEHLDLLPFDKSIYVYGEDKKKAKIVEIKLMLNDYKDVSSFAIDEWKYYVESSIHHMGWLKYDDYLKCKPDLKTEVKRVSHKKQVSKQVLPSFGKGTKLVDVIEEKIDIGRPVKLDLFVMSKCPYGVSAEKAIKPIIDDYGDYIDFNLYFIAREMSDGTIESMHGKDEVEENIRQLVIQEYYPDLFFDYLITRADNYQEDDYEQKVTKFGMDLKLIDSITYSPVGEDILKQNIRIAQKYSISGSPTIVVDGKRYKGNTRTTPAQDGTCCVCVNGLILDSDDLPENYTCNYWCVSRASIERLTYPLVSGLTCGSPCSNLNGACWENGQLLCHIGTFSESESSCIPGSDFKCNAGSWSECIGTQDNCSCNNWSAPSPGTSCSCVECIQHSDCDDFFPYNQYMKCCDGLCKNTYNDVHNCDDCGIECDEWEDDPCKRDECQATNCLYAKEPDNFVVDIEHICCDGERTSSYYDGNCGACGVTCVNNQCTTGVCQLNEATGKYHCKQTNVPDNTPADRGLICCDGAVTDNNSIPNCGTCGEDCDDEDGCTTDTCENGVCVHTPIEDCDPEDPESPVTLSSFTAIYSNGSSTLQWTTQSETNNAGWNVYRAESEDFAECLQINHEFINGAGTITTPSDYCFIDSYEVVPGHSYYFWIESVDYGGTTELHGPAGIHIPFSDGEIIPPELAEQYGISIHPNPFNPSTTISYKMEESKGAKLTVYNSKGRVIRTYNDLSVNDSGAGSVTWNGEDMKGNSVSSGIYYSKLQTSKNEYIKKMILVK